MAIVHEWLHDRSGSETTFEEMAKVFPAADLFALSREPGVTYDVGDRKIATTVLDRSVLRRHRGLTLPAMPLAWALVGATGPRYDVVITSSHALVNTAGMVRRAGVALCYCHTPARYLWMPQLDDRGRLAPAPVRRALRRLDRGAAGRIVGFAANSTETAWRVRRFYGRDAVVVPPPVDTEHYTPAPADAGEPLPAAVHRFPEYLLAVSRFVGYKRLDLAVDVAAAVRLPLVLAGHGPGEADLRARAARSEVPVELVVGPSREELRALYRGAAVLVFPALEDFGIVPVEAQACGTPVVGLAAGGTLDTVVDGSTGVLAGEQTVPALAAATRRALADLAGRSATATACREHALRFSTSCFDDRLRRWVGDHARL
jgi:glycosyltransferase involved in cell wall biosynthesis